MSEKTNSSLLINDAHHNQSPPSSPIVVLNDDVTQVENNNHEPESANNSSVAIDSEAAPGKNSSSFLGVTPEVTTPYPSYIIMPGVRCDSGGKQQS